MRSTPARASTRTLAIASLIDFGRTTSSWSSRGAPEAGLEHRNSLLQPIWHLSTPQRRDDEHRVTSGLPGDARPDAEAAQILANKCSIVKRPADRWRASDEVPC